MGISGESIASISFTTIGGAGINSVRQVRLDVESGVGTPGTIPEPATWALMIVGFGLVGVGARRQKRTVVSA